MLSTKDAHKNGTEQEGMQKVLKQDQSLRMPRSKAAAAAEVQMLGPTVGLQGSRPSALYAISLWKLFVGPSILMSTDEQQIAKAKG